MKPQSGFMIHGQYLVKAREQPLLIISINFTPKTSYSCQKIWYTNFLQDVIYIISFISTLFFHLLIIWSHLLCQHLRPFCPRGGSSGNFFFPGPPTHRFCPGGFPGQKDLFKKQRNQVYLGIRNRTNHSFFPLEKGPKHQDKCQKKSHPSFKRKNLMVWPPIFILPRVYIWFLFVVPDWNSKPVKIFQFHQCELYES